MAVIKRWRNLLKTMVESMIDLQEAGLKAQGYFSIEGVIDYDADVGGEVDLDSPHLDKIGVSGPQVDAGLSKEHLTQMKAAIRIET